MSITCRGGSGWTFAEANVVMILIRVAVTTIAGVESVTVELQFAILKKAVRRIAGFPPRPAG